jgi:hypothetical protein
MIKDKAQKILLFWSFSNNRGFLMKGKQVPHPFCDASIAKATVALQHRFFVIFSHGYFLLSAFLCFSEKTKNNYNFF